jgi:hypothetical protein
LEGEIKGLLERQADNDKDTETMRLQFQGILSSRAEAEATKTRAERDAQEKNKDIVTMERRQLAALGATGRLLDLNSPECAALRERYADRLVYPEANDEEYSVEPVPVGIDVSDSLLMTKYHLYGAGDCVLGIGANTGRLDQVETFLNFIFQEK